MLKYIIWFGLFFLACSNSIVAQTKKITLDQAITFALQNNTQIKLKLLQEKYVAAVQLTAKDIPKMHVNSEFGSINTSNLDTRFTINQSFALPKLYNSQKAVFNTLFTQAQLQTVLQKASIIKLVKLAYLQVSYIQQQQTTYQIIDSIYKGFQQVAQLRFTKGESILLEKSTIDNQVMQVQLHKQQLVYDEQIALVQLKVLLNTNEPLQVVDTLNSWPLLLDTTLSNLHPFLATIIQQQQVALAQTNVEKAKLLPEFNIGYSNQSIVGWQMQKDRSESYYNSGNRFSIAQAGVAFPLFNKAQKAKVKAAEEQQQIVAYQASMVQKELQQQVEKLILERNKFVQTIEYYKQSALLQSTSLITNANLNYRNGLLTYIEWGTLFSQAIQIQLEYINALWQLNQNNIELAFLLAPNK